MTLARPAAIALDVLETLVPLDPLRPRLTALGLPESSLELWFAGILRDAFGLTAAGDHRPFSEVAGWNLRGLLSTHGLPTEGAGAVIGAFAELPLRPDVEPALRQLQDEGVPVHPLTNGGAETTARILERGGVGALVGRPISVDEVGASKPSPRPYLHAARVAGVEPGRLALIAAHAWDVHGAARAGLSTGYVARGEAPFPEGMRSPDASGRDLSEVVGALLRASPS